MYMLINQQVYVHLHSMLQRNKIMVIFKQSETLHFIILVINWKKLVRKLADLSECRSMQLLWTDSK